MKKAIISKPAKTAMQSGKRNTKEWMVEFEESGKYIESLMGWTGSRAGTYNQVKIYFETLEAAKRYIESKGVPYEVITSNAPKRIIKAYADNFTD